MANIIMLEEENLMPDLSKDIHYISWTPLTSSPTKFGNQFFPYSGLSYQHAIVLNATGETPIYLFSQIDALRETGTLYPKHNITLMPGGVYEDEDIYAQFADAVKAQQMIKAHHIIFDMRFYTYFNPKTLEEDNREYIEMIRHEKNRFDFDESEVNLYILPNKNDLSRFHSIFGIRWASEEEIAYLKNG